MKEEEQKKGYGACFLKKFNNYMIKNYPHILKIKARIFSGVERFYEKCDFRLIGTYKGYTEFEKII